MEKTSLQADRSLLHSGRKRSFSMPRFGRSSANKSSIEEGANTGEDAVRVQKAAAWQWYTRGVGEVVLPTQRPSPVPPSRSKSGSDNSCCEKGKQQYAAQEKQLEAPVVAAGSPRALSRFKAEASSFTGPIGGGNADPSPPSAAAPVATPLYDEFELSGLRTQMAGFVQRLQQGQSKAKGQLPPPTSNVAEISKSMESPIPASSSDDLNLAPENPPAAAAEAGGRPATAYLSDHQRTKPLLSSIPVNSAVHFSMRPFSALHRLFRKVVPGSILKFSKNSPVTHSPLTTAATYYHPEVSAGEEEHTEYHHHHYIHHHHHHYHYGKSPEESTEVLRRLRRSSESSVIRPPVPSILEVDSDEDEGVGRSPMDAYLARLRRRHSDSFSLHGTSKEADFDGKFQVKSEAEKAALMLPLRSPRSYNSERISPSKIRLNKKQDLLVEPAEVRARDDLQERCVDIKSRRYSADHHRNSRPGIGEVEVAGSNNKLGGGGGKTRRGTYKLSGGEDGTMPVVARALGSRRRHSSDGSQIRQRKEGDRCDEMEESPTSPAGRAYWHTASERYLEAVLERQQKMGISATATGGRLPPRRLSRELPPLYPR